MAVPVKDLVRDPRRVLLVALGLGLFLRLLVLGFTSGLGLGIVDEQQYGQIARSLVAGDGYAWGPGRPTSIRPPLYPALVAGVWSLAGGESLQTVRFIQIFIALAMTALVYFLGARVLNSAVGAYAGAIVWLYPSLMFSNFLILTETLFTFFLVAFVLLAVLLVQAPRPSIAAACGAVLGLAALTRSIMWPMPILLCPLLALMIRAPLSRRLALPALLLAGYAVVVVPWAVRNTRLQGVVTIVDTMGGINLRMGNYEHTPEDRMWDAVSLRGEKNWVHGLDVETGGRPATEGEKDKWAQARAIEYILDHPGQSLQRALIKFADFWGLEREFIAGVREGLFDVPTWIAVLGSLAIVAGYVAVAVAGVAGLWLMAPADWRVHVLMLLPIVLITGLHTIVFAHSRYHLPLIPLLAIYGASLAVNWKTALWRPGSVRAGAIASIVVLIGIWIRQLVIVDFERIRSLLG